MTTARLADGRARRQYKAKEADQPVDIGSHKATLGVASCRRTKAIP